MQEHPISFSTDVTIAGTVCLPDRATAAEPAPAIVLLGGTGGDTRDGEINPTLFPADSRPPDRGLLRKIAHELADSGIATLRFDKRGVGESTGDFDGANYDSDLIDNTAAFRFLQSFPSVDARRVGLAGHSAGAFNVCIVCRDVPEVACAGLLGALHGPIDELVRFNWPRIANSWDRFSYEQREWLLTHRPREVVLSFNAEACIEAAATGEAAIDVEAFGQRLVYNPLRLRQDMERPVAGEFRHVRCPALVLHGGADLNVKVEDCLGTYQALRAAGNEDVDLVIVPRLEHSFLEVPPGMDDRIWERVSLQAWARPTSRVALAAISSWATRVLGVR